MAHTTSATLLHRVRRADDRLAWARFVDLYAPLIFDWGRLAGMSHEDAADLSQDVLVHLLAEMPRFDYSSERGRFRGWLRTVTVNMCRDQQRRKNIAVARGGDSNSIELADSSTGIAFWEQEYHQYVVNRALKLMRSDFETHVWQAAWQQVVEQRNPIEVAAELGLSLATVYQSRSRVLRKLREQLRDLVDDF